MKLDKSFLRIVFLAALIHTLLSEQVDNNVESSDDRAKKLNGAVEGAVNKVLSRHKRAIPPVIISAIVSLVGDKLLGSVTSGLNDKKNSTVTSDFITDIIKKLAGDILNKNIQEDISKEIAAVLTNFDTSTAKTAEELQKNVKDIMDSLLKANEANLASAASVNVVPSAGMNVGDLFSPAGVKITTKYEYNKRKPDVASQTAYSYDEGLGNALANGCFMPVVHQNDPCFNAKRLIPKCNAILESANFIGVGFDGRGDYSSVSRKKSIIQRSCIRGGRYDGWDVPDSMTVHGVYDTEVRTEAFSGLEQYRTYLETKAAVSNSKFAFQEAVVKASGSASVGFLGLVGGGGGAGFEAGGSSSSSSTSSSSSASGSTQSGVKQTYMSMLEIDIIRYEIFLDEVTPQELNIDFLHDFLSLPESFFSTGAPAKFQNFILRYGTHYIKSAKFGGQLKLIKTKEATQTESVEKFAEKAQDDYKRMFSVYGAYSATTKTGSIFHKTSVTTSGSASGGGGAAGSSSTETKEGKEQFEENKYSNEVMIVQGGDQGIAALISEMYTVSFQHELTEWLESIPDYPKPTEFQMEPIPELLCNINYKQLFPAGEQDFGCFGGQTILTEPETGRRYYLWKELVPDNENTTVNETHVKMERRYCDYLNQQGLEDAILRRCRSLKRAVAIYMEEGPIPSSDIHLRPGRRGCKTNTLGFDDFRTRLRVPTWDDMKSGAKFRILFDMPYNLVGIAESDDSLLMFYRSSDQKWYVQTGTGIVHLFDGYNNGGSDDVVNNMKISVRGLVLEFNPNNGLLKVASDVFASSSQKLHPALPDNLSGQTVGRVEYVSMLSEISKHEGAFGIGTVPCNIVWSNAHRINPSVFGGRCITFTAVSEGDIFVVFSAIPSDYRTWYYVQISPAGIAIYKAEMVMKFVDDRNARGLGDPHLYETYFVCIDEEADGSKTTIKYGKMDNSEDGSEVYVVFEDQADPLHIRFFAFANGEHDANIMDAQVVPTAVVGKHRCKGGTIPDEDEECIEDCHPECIGCHRKGSNKFCRDCRHYREGDACVANCSAAYKINSQGDTCICRYIVDNQCVESCPADRILAPGDSSSGSQPCKCRYYLPEDTDTCLPVCPALTYENKNVPFGTQCDLCNAACIQQQPGTATCTGPSANDCTECVKINNKCADCAAGTYLKYDGSVYSCSACPVGARCPGDGRAYLCDTANNLRSSPDRTSCIQCPFGYYSTVPVSDTCHSCKAGFYKKKGDTVCRACPEGTGGINCEKVCSCENGKCDPTTGKCVCYAQFTGPRCETPLEGAIRLRLPGLIKLDLTLAYQELARRTDTYTGWIDQPAPGDTIRQPIDTISQPINKGTGLSDLSRLLTGRRRKRALPGFNTGIIDTDIQLDPDKLAPPQTVATTRPTTTPARATSATTTQAPPAGAIEGRVEIYHNGLWGTVCNDGFDKTEATVVCKQFNHNVGEKITTGSNNYGSGRIWLDDVACMGGERLLSECPHSRWGVTNCQHYEDVSVRCYTRSRWLNFQDLVIKDMTLRTDLTKLSQVSFKR